MVLVAGFVAFVVLDSPLGVAALVAGALIEVGELVFWVRFLRRYRIRTGVEAMIGARGVAVSACGAEPGQVRFEGALWRARCAPGVTVAPGDEVEVTAIDGLTLTVAPTGRRG
jgi:membrane protein implicated in regulation of membrane protease activity